MGQIFSSASTADRAGKGANFFGHIYVSQLGEKSVRILELPAEAQPSYFGEVLSLHSREKLLVATNPKASQILFFDIATEPRFLGSLPFHSDGVALTEKAIHLNNRTGSAIEVANQLQTYFEAESWRVNVIPSSVGLTSLHFDVVEI